MIIHSSEVHTVAADGLGLLGVTWIEHLLAQCWLDLRKTHVSMTSTWMVNPFGAEYILTLNTLNCFEDYKRCIHISYHILDFVQQKTRFIMEQPHILPILYCQYHACSCPSSLSRQGISRHGIDPQSWNIQFPASGEFRNIRIFCISCISQLWYGTGSQNPSS